VDFEQGDTEAKEITRTHFEQGGKNKCSRTLSKKGYQKKEKQRHGWGGLPTRCNVGENSAITQSVLASERKNLNNKGEEEEMHLWEGGDQAFGGEKGKGVWMRGNIPEIGCGT